MTNNEDKNPHNNSQQAKRTNATPPQPLSDLYIRFVNLLNAISIRPF